LKNDEAIAPIIAVMLILAVVVTLLSVYNATYLPGLKQSAEVQHLHEVEEGVLKFGSALEEAASLKRNISLSQQIPLGGGDILFNSLKSGGSLRVQQESEPYLTISNYTAEAYNLTLINFSYWTVNNFWVDQGYTWQYGYVNVSRNAGSGGGTPLQYATMGDLSNDIVSFGKSLIYEIETNEDGSNITIEAVNFYTDENSFTSGNGYGKLKLNATRNKVFFDSDYSHVKLSVHDTVFSDCLQNYADREYPNKNVTLILTNITVSAY
jgi:hypothetical protein